MIVGVDVSSRRIDLAWLEDGRPCRWHQELGGGKHDDHLIDRLRRIRVQWPRHFALSPHTGVPYDTGDEPTDIAIEMPFGQSRSSIGALMAVTGIVTRQAPRWARVAWPSSGELRAAIGARNTKQSAHDYLRTITGGTAIWGWNEHEIDALVACVGWTRILEAQDAA